MAALSSTCFSLPALNYKTLLYTTTSPSNLKTHLAFPPSTSKRLNFSIKAGKKDYFPNDSSKKEDEVKSEPNRNRWAEFERLEFMIAYLVLENVWDKMMDEEIRKLYEEIMKMYEELALSNKDQKKPQRLIILEEAYRPLNLSKLSSCFDETIFSLINAEQVGSDAIFYGYRKVPVDQAMPILEKKLSEAAGKEVYIFFNQFNELPEGVEVVTMLQKPVTDILYEIQKLRYPTGYATAAALSIATLGTTALMSGLFLKPDATFDYYLTDVLPLFGGFLTILGVSEIATRVTASRYGVELSPSFFIPSIGTGCFGVLNIYGSNIPNRKAYFDIPAARAASSYLTSLLLIAAAFLSDGSLNGGDNPLYIRPDFFFNNPLISLLQFFTKDELSNMLLPYEVEGVGVTLDPLAFAGILGMIVTSLNLLPCGLEGRRIIRAMSDRSKSDIISYASQFILVGIGTISGSVLYVTWGILSIIYQISTNFDFGPKDAITPLDNGRYALGLFLALVCYLTLFPNADGTSFSWSLFEPYFRGFVV